MAEFLWMYLQIIIYSIYYSRGILSLSLLSFPPLRRWNFNTESKLCFVFKIFFKNSLEFEGFLFTGKKMLLKYLIGHILKLYK